MEMVLRITIIYFFLMASMRVLGKREFGELSPFELVTVLMIPEIVTQVLTQGDQSLIGALVGVSTLFVLVYLTTIVTQRSKKVHELVAGVSTVLVDKGRFVEENLQRERVTPEDVFTAMHRAGLANLPQVRWAILEDDGKIAIIPHEPQSPGKGRADVVDEKGGGAG
ncbi:MAG: DUF421 domain-containing protein [Anaerolineae bacterium]|nr:DUF421 domain-containing protein [Anaerolineae bacterium]